MAKTLEVHMRPALYAIFATLAILSSSLGCKSEPSIDYEQSRPTDRVGAIDNSTKDKTSLMASFTSLKLPFEWDKVVRVENEVDGLIVNHVVFSERKPWIIFKSTEIKIQVEVQVTNGGTVKKYPTFSIAVFNKDGELVGVTSGGATLLGVSPKETKSYVLVFDPMRERVSSGSTFHISAELR